MRSSWTSVAVWMNSIPIARLKTSSGSAVPSRADRITSAGRRRLPPALTMCDIALAIGPRSDAISAVEPVLELLEFGGDRLEQLLGGDAHDPAASRTTGGAGRHQARIRQWLVEETRCGRANRTRVGGHHQLERRRLRVDAVRSCFEMVDREDRDSLAPRSCRRCRRRATLRAPMTRPSAGRSSG